MRAHTTLRTLVARRTRRIVLGFAAALLTSISVMNLVSQLHAEGAGTGTGIVTIAHFAANPLGSDRWFVDGVVVADDMSTVSIEMGGAAVAIGTITPDPDGFFAFEIAANPYDYVTAAASDGMTTSNADVTLYNFF